MCRSVPESKLFQNHIACGMGILFKMNSGGYDLNTFQPPFEMPTKDIRSRQSTGFPDCSALADGLTPTSQFS